ncbi:MAG: CAP domain-containing protein [Hyphomicrobiales bacterium]|nr:CAP domain-containing protein [Hyphomicrobiales bacterium]
MSRFSSVRGIGLNICALLAGLLLSSCSTPPADRPIDSMYVRLEQNGTSLDPVSALGLINAYRNKKGLPPLQLDADMMKAAEVSAGKAAAEDRSTFGEMPQLPASGGRSAHIKLSAGYLTLAEAFSGWRDVPLYDRAMLSPQARFLGVAAIRAPGAKYRVYWALVTDG